MRVFSKIFIMGLAAFVMGCNCPNNGDDFSKDLPADQRPAMQEILDKASSGDTNAQAYLGVLFYTGTIGRNNEAAMNWFKKASENGSGEADYFLAEMYEGGIHVAQDSETAFKYLKSAASKGFTSARIKLAEMYLKGEKEASLNKSELLDWLGTYASEGNEKAKEILTKFQKTGDDKKAEAVKKAEPAAKAEPAKKAVKKKAAKPEEKK